LIQRYFTEPYRFIAPHRGKLWCHLSSILMPRHLRRKMAVTRLAYQGLDRLIHSRQQKAGILLCGNHCRDADPVVVGVMARQLRTYLYYVVSYHLFKQSRFVGWWINRIGGFSIWREGADREALRAASQLLVDAERPLAIFPEGTWFRQNDRLGPLQEGLTLIVRQAARQTDRPVLIHPVAVKYWYLEDPRPILKRRLEHLERRIGWKPQVRLDFVPRIEKLFAALLAIKEVEYLGQTRPGSLDERFRGLAVSILGPMEKLHFGREVDGSLMERVRRLRLKLARLLIDSADNPEECRQTREALDTLLFCENLAAHSHEYLIERPSLERIAETVLRIEETVSDEFEKPVAPSGAVVRIGEALDVRSFPPLGGPNRHTEDPLMRRLAADMQGLLDQLLAEGPPPEWGCPPRIESLPASAAPAAP
jgi:1-acyl-sn-glycerol-3-phosphate acyltransferase